MLNFSEQCMDMARSILGKNIDAINADGSIIPVENESSLDFEPGHAALALGEFYRATGLTEIEGRDIVDLCARCITAQTNDKEYTEDGLAYSSLGLLSFGPSKDRNAVWDRLLEETRRTSTSVCSRAPTMTTISRFSTSRKPLRVSAWGLARKTKPASS